MGKIRQADWAFGALLSLGAISAACGPSSPPLGDDEGGTGGGAPGGGSLGVDGSGTGASPSAGGGPGAGGGSFDGLACKRGVPATSQVPRLLNREYDAAVRDLLDVQGLTTQEGKLPSTLLNPDYDGSLNAFSWDAYLDAGAKVAAEVISGPLKTNFLACDPATQPTCFAETIRAFGRKAFRRALTETEVERFERFVNLEPPGSPDQIAEAILATFLSSPSFIMVPELAQTPDPETGAIRLSAEELAMRLSLLIWGSVPDDILNEAVDRGELETREQILAQAERMVKVRAKTGPLISTFHRQDYLNVRPNSHWGTDHDVTKYPKYSPEVVPVMLAELDAFFEDVAFASGGFDDLFLSNVAFVNRVTAPIYGLNQAEYGDELERVELSASERPGFLTRIGFLSSFSSPDATSPILRGAFISRHVIAAEFEDPDPNNINQPFNSAGLTSMRQITEARTGSGICSECHTLYVNPPGFVLEGFDAIGGTQTVDPLGGALDLEAEVYFGPNDVRNIATPLELMNEIGRSGPAIRRYAERWVTFAYGRAPNENDACVVQDLEAKLGGTEYTLLNLITDLTQADSFRLRTPEN